ncbi:hypothetical protein A7K91_15965 [Paenibacillus oryzae]|uniref:DUF1266 domain-containing protein n=1 Tax=Paenibacillus oryzae TaxID=1844972 RepID=A0A1A5YEV2_9BACL|nr:DUF1266 domain-containing protein [Paenibacillus oryzae]OBR64114.1 hypothetical protein A7K91_15965 [Paenibacillus oryzae]
MTGAANRPLMSLAEAYRLSKKSEFRRLGIVTALLFFVLALSVVFYSIQFEYVYAFFILISTLFLCYLLVWHNRLTDYLGYRRFVRQWPELCAVPEQVVWMYISTSGLHGHLYNIVIADSFGNRHLLDFADDSLMAERWLQAGKETFPLCIFGHEPEDGLFDLYTKDPAVFYLYAKRLMQPVKGLPVLSLQQARQHARMMPAHTPPSTFEGLPQDPIIRFMVGCDIRFCIMPNAYSIFEVIRETGLYVNKMPLFFAEIFYSLDYAKDRYHGSDSIKETMENDALERLARFWDITDRPSLIHYLNWLLQTGQRGDINIKEISSVRNIFPHVRTTAGFDIARFVQIVRCGLVTGLLNDSDEAEAWLAKCHRLFTCHFAGYDDFVDSYLAGLYAWSPTAYQAGLQGVCYAYMNPYCPWNTHKGGSLHFNTK